MKTLVLLGCILYIFIAGYCLAEHLDKTFMTITKIRRLEV